MTTRRSRRNQLVWEALSRPGSTDRAESSGTGVGAVLAGAGTGVRSPQATYRICPRCGRSVAASTHERFCINDGEPLTERCARCQTEIGSPYARFCAVCGLPYNRPAR